MGKTLFAVSLVYIATCLVVPGCVKQQPAATPVAGLSPNGKERDSIKLRIEIHVTPYYDANGPKVDVGKYSKDLEGATATSIPELASTMDKVWDSLPVEVMYVMSIRLYDLGLKDEATYWFYSAQYRARLLFNLVPHESVGPMGAPGFELAAALDSFFDLAGSYINGHAFGDTGKLLTILGSVKEKSKTIPDFKSIYPSLKFFPDESWSDKNREIAAGFDKFINDVTKRADEIKATRQKNGIEGNY
jgi:hypothetical protein